jgi:hypothetical protein
MDVSEYIRTTYHLHHDYITNPDLVPLSDKLKVMHIGEGLLGHGESKSTNIRPFLDDIQSGCYFSVKHGRQKFCLKAFTQSFKS